MLDIAILAIGLIAYFASVLMAVRVSLQSDFWKERPFQRAFWKGLPYPIGIMPAGYFWKYGINDVLGGVVLFAAITWVIVWGFKKELGGPASGKE